MHFFGNLEKKFATILEQKLFRRTLGKKNCVREIFSPFSR
jgi:hypothetical protein